MTALTVVAWVIVALIVVLVLSMGACVVAALNGIRETLERQELERDLLDERDEAVALANELVRRGRAGRPTATQELEARVDAMRAARRGTCPDCGMLLVAHVGGRPCPGGGRA